MFSFLKKIFKKEPPVVQEKKVVEETKPAEEKPMSNRYDVEVFDYAADGRPMKSIEQGVFAESRNELISLYGQCGQKIRIIREYKDDGKSVTNQANDPTMAIGMDKLNLLPMPKVPQEYQEQVQKQVEQMKNPQPETKPAKPQISVSSPQQQKQIVQPPFYFKVGTVDCKMENGQIYQKQWVRVTDTDLANYRMLSEKTNKIIPFNGKVLEVLKWISVKDDESETGRLIHQITNSQPETSKES